MNLMPRQNGGIYSARPSFDDLRHRQQGGLYGVGTSLEFVSAKAGEYVDYQSESVENDSEISDQTEGDKPDMTDDLRQLDI